MIVQRKETLKESPHLDVAGLSRRPHLAEPINGKQGNLYIVYNAYDVMKLLVTGLFHGFLGVLLVLSIKYRRVTNKLKMAMMDDLRHNNEC